MRSALDAVRRRPGRSFLTALGIGMATALVVVLLAVSAGVQSSAAQLASESGVDLLGASANTSLSSLNFPYLSGAHSLSTGIPASDSNVQTSSPWLIQDLNYGNSSMWASANQSTNGSSIPATWAITDSGTIGWIPSDNTGIEVPTLYAGPGFTYRGDPHYANGTYDGPTTDEIVLDEGLAGVLHVVPGDLVWLGVGSPSGPSQVEAWYSNATAFRVVGISGPFWLIPSALLAFTYLSELQTLIGADTPQTDYASLVLLHLYNDANPDQDRELIEIAYPELTVFTIQAILGAIQDAVNLYQIFGEIIAVIAVVVAALFTTTVLLMSVDDRSNEIAVRRAIGLPRWAVGGSVVEESLYLGLLGLAIGLPLAELGSWLLNTALTRLVQGLPTGFTFVSFDPMVLALGVLLVLTVGLVASIAPAARALSLPIAEELRAP
ncbi:MAG: ABC transporter permease [Thermoplasmata archaeon]